MDQISMNFHYPHGHLVLCNNDPKTQWLKTISMYYLIQFLRTRHPEQLNWGVLAQGFS